MTPIPVLVGPTAAGKTRLAVEMARREDAVILSADARQLYRGFDVATGKEGTQGEFVIPGLGTVPARYLDGVPQIGLDLAAPTDRFSAGRWAGWARGAIGALRTEGRNVVVAGGTGLYVDALVHGFTFPGRTAWGDLTFETLLLDPPRDELRGRIERRVHGWFEGEALAREVEARLRDGVPTDAEPFTAIGYQEALAVAAGRCDRDEAIRRAIQRTWDYSRRQRTYFRNRFARDVGTPNILMNDGTAGPGRAR